MFLIIFLLLCKNLILETSFFLLIGLLSLSFFLSLSLEICGACSLCEWLSLLTYLTLLSIVIFREVIYVKKAFDSVILNQLIKNLSL